MSVYPRTIAKKAAQLALAKKAHDVLVMDLRKVTSITDFFVICSADSDTHVKAVADAVLDGLKKSGVTAWHDEGYEALNWVLLDYVDVVVHIFRRDIRKFYNLERLWADAEIEVVEDKQPKGSQAQARSRTTKRKEEKGWNQK